MATAAKMKRSPAMKEIPEIEGFSSIVQELRNLQKVMQIKENSSI